jgi:hypothetical protein
MSRFISKKRALLGAAATSLALVAVAFAWYSTTGSGLGEDAGTTADGYPNELVITGTADASTLVPGGEVSISNGNLHNGNTGSAKHGTVSATVTTTKEGCNAATNFEVKDIVLNGSSAVIAAGGDRTFTAKLAMKDLAGADQDACKSAPLSIDWSSN